MSVGFAIALLREGLPFGKKTGQLQFSGGPMFSFCNGSLWYAFNQHNQHNQFNKFVVKLVIAWVIAQVGMIMMYSTHAEAAMAVESFTLINAETDKDLGPISNGAVINLAEVGSKLTIRANVSGTIGSVKMTLDDSTSHIENLAPYALFGDANGGDYNAGSFSLGSHTLTATPYSYKGGGGSAGSTLSVSFKIINQVAPSFKVDRLILVDSAKNQDIKTLTNGATINLAEVGDQLNIRAEVSGSLGSVVFILNGATHVENIAPYYLFGDSGDVANAGSLIMGTNKLVVKPFSKSSASGTEGGGLNISFNIIDKALLPAPIADSLVKNASLESGTANWDQSWRDSAIVSSGQRSGSRALRVGPGDGGFGQDVASQVNVGSEYRLTAYARVSTGDIAGYLRVAFKNNNDAVISRKFVKITSTSYSKYSLDFTVPSGATQVYVQGVRDSGGSGYVFLDDFELKLLSSSTPNPSTPSPIADSLVKNASLESGTTEWNQRWKDSAIVTSGQRSGSRALRVGPGDGGYGQDVFSRVKVGEEYRLTAYARVSTGDIAAYLRVAFKNSRGAVISRKFVNITSTSYSKYSVDFTVPSGSTQVYVQGVRGIDGSSGYVFLDDFELKPTGSTSPTPDPDPTPDPGTSASAAANAYCQMHAGMDHSGGSHSTPHPDDPEKHEEHVAAMGLLSPSNATHIAVKCGLWSAASTWKNGRIPKTGADVHIPMGLGVTYDVNSQEELHYVRVDGFMDFATQKNTLMKVNTIIASPSSVFHIGTKAAPIRSNVNAKIVVLDDGPINMSHDPLQVSRGLILHGKTEIHGMKKKSFLALKVNPRAGDRSLTVSGTTTNWKVGDEIVVVGTHPFQGIKRLGASPSEDEVRTITGISGDTIQLDSALTYNHDVISGHGFLNYVGNASRNVSIRSENPNGTRGHFMIMHSPKAQIRYAEFRDLGRSDRRIAVSDTNPIGRYSLHLHRTGATATSEMAIAEGNAVINGPGWGIVHHDSFAAVNHNFVFNFVGAGIVSEAGSEVGEWIGNLVTSVTGNGYGHSENDYTNMRKFGPGFNGIAYFGASRAVIQQHNIAANTRLGWDFEGRLGGASGKRAGTQHIDSRAFKFDATPFQNQASDSDTFQFIGFVGNRAFALGTIMRSTHRRHGSQTNTINEMRDFKAWRVTSIGFNFRNYTWDYTFRDFVVIGTGKSSAFVFWDKTEGMSFVNVHIENFGVAIDYGFFNYAGVLTNVKFVNNRRNIYTETDRLEALYQDYLSGKRASDPRPTHPQTGKRYIPQAIPLKFVNSSVSQSSKPIVTMDPSNVYEVRPGGQVSLKGTVKDSFGEYAFGNSMWWFSPQVYAAPTHIMKDYKATLNYTGKLGDAPLDVILPKHGVIRRSDGWYMPVTFWIGDRFTSINHPHTLYFKVIGMSESFLQKYELKNYEEPTNKLDLYNSQSDY